MKKDFVMLKKYFMIGLSVVAILNAQDAPKGVEGLSGETRALLAEEMGHIEAGMKEVFSHMVKGEYDEVAKIAGDIQESFIFKKKLNDAQRAELKANLSKEFIALDRSFHETAGKMAEAAEFSDKEGIVSAYYEMSKKCVACHSQFATHRFTAFEAE